jgi:hypothetical protein
MSEKPPSQNQTALAKAIAKQTDKRLPPGYAARQSVCSQFIEENLDHIQPTEAQVSFALGLARLYGLNMDRFDFSSYRFCKRFLDLFSGTKTDAYQGYRRMRIIESYLREDKEFEHLQFKLDLAAEDVAFMRSVIVTFGHGGSLTRWDDLPSGEATLFPELADHPPDSEPTVSIKRIVPLGDISSLYYLPDEERQALLVAVPDRANKKAH